MGKIRRDFDRTRWSDPQMNGQPLVVAIIVNWNRRELLIEAIDSLQADGYQNLKIVVVDNASSDGSADVVAQRYPDILLIRSLSNFGYAAGNNRGIECALKIGAEYVFFLNNDAMVQPGCLNTLTQVLQTEQECGAVAPYILYTDRPDVIWFGGGAVSLWSGQVRHRHIRERFATGRFRPEKTGYLTGCALLMRCRVLRKIGSFDESYLLYSEDVDLCIRTQIAGWYLKVTPDATALHRVSASTGGELTPIKAFYRARSTALLLKRFAPSGYWLLLPLLGTAGFTAACLGLVVTGRWRIISALMKGILNGLFNRRIPSEYHLDFA